MRRYNPLTILLLLIASSSSSSDALSLSRFVGARIKQCKNLGSTILRTPTTRTTTTTTTNDSCLKTDGQQRNLSTRSFSLKHSRVYQKAAKAFVGPDQPVKRKEITAKEEKAVIALAVGSIKKRARSFFPAVVGLCVGFFHRSGTVETSVAHAAPAVSQTASQVTRTTTGHFAVSSGAVTRGVAVATAAGAGSVAVLKRNGKHDDEHDDTNTERRSTTVLSLKRTPTPPTTTQTEEELSELEKEKQQVEAAQQRVRQVIARVKEAQAAAQAKAQYAEAEARAVQASSFEEAAEAKTNKEAAEQDAIAALKQAETEMIQVAMMEEFTNSVEARRSLMEQMQESELVIRNALNAAPQSTITKQHNGQTQINTDGIETSIISEDGITISDVQEAVDLSQEVVLVDNVQEDDVVATNLESLPVVVNEELSVLEAEDMVAVQKESTFINVDSAQDTTAEESVAPLDTDASSIAEIDVADDVVVDDVFAVVEQKETETFNLELSPVALKEELHLLELGDYVAVEKENTCVNVESALDIIDAEDVDFLETELQVAVNDDDVAGEVVLADADSVTIAVQEEIASSNVKSSSVVENLKLLSEEPVAVEKESTSMVAESVQPFTFETLFPPKEDTAVTELEIVSVVEDSVTASTDTVVIGRPEDDVKSETTQAVPETDAVFNQEEAAIAAVSNVETEVEGVSLVFETDEETSSSIVDETAALTEDKYVEIDISSNDEMACIQTEAELNVESSDSITGEISEIVNEKNNYKFPIMSSWNSKTSSNEEEKESQFTVSLKDDYFDYGEVAHDFLPLQDPVHIKARQQPKVGEEEVQLKQKYAAIQSLTDRAYQILLDLGMVEST